ncbi:MAG: TetR/AcrR family transcriptional regulator [Neptuniibacter sp.]
MCPNGNADLTRSLIINSAVQIISQSGLSALTAGKLIDHAGISKGGLYHHFRTMQEVEIEVLERILQNLTLEVHSYPDPTTHAEFLDQIEQMLFDHLLQNSEYSRALFAFMSEAANNPKVKVLLRNLSDDFVLNWQRQLSALNPGASVASLHNTAQIISTIHIGLTSRFFLTEDQTCLKLYWRGCRGILSDLLGIAHVHSYDEQPENSVPKLVPANVN